MNQISSPHGGDWQNPVIPPFFYGNLLDPIFAGIVIDILVDIDQSIR